MHYVKNPSFIIQLVQFNKYTKIRLATMWKYQLETERFSNDTPNSTA